MTQQNEHWPKLLLDQWKDEFSIHRSPDHGGIEKTEGAGKGNFNFLWGGL
jgi:hypothetical protein